MENIHVFCHTCHKHCLIYPHIPLGCNEVTESTHSVPEAESQDRPDNTEEVQDVQSDVAESTELIEHLKPSGSTEPTIDPAEELEQSTGPSLDYALIA